MLLFSIQYASQPDFYKFRFFQPTTRMENTVAESTTNALNLLPPCVTGYSWNGNEPEQVSCHPYCALLAQLMLCCRDERPCSTWEHHAIEAMSILTTLSDNGFTVRQCQVMNETDPCDGYTLEQANEDLTFGYEWACTELRKVRGQRNLLALIAMGFAFLMIVSGLFS